jgi:hypothetical protein
MIEWRRLVRETGRIAFDSNRRGGHRRHEVSATSGDIFIFIAGLVESMRALPAGDASPDAPGAHESGPQRGAVAAEASETTRPAWRRWWRRMTGRAVDPS